MIIKNMRIVNRELLDKHLEDYPVCEYCKCSMADEVHHIQTKGSGGGDTPYNILSVCRSCHTLIHSGCIERIAIVTIVSTRECVDIDEIEDSLIRMRRGSYDILCK